MISRDEYLKLPREERFIELDSSENGPPKLARELVRQE
jgi:hypothetical protein